MSADLLPTRRPSAWSPWGRGWLFLAVLVFLVTQKTHKTFMGQGDEPHYAVMSESLVLDRDLDLANNYHSPYLRDFDDHHSLIRPDGREVPFHSVGFAILGAPLYAADALARKALGGLSREASWILVKNSYSFAMMIVAAFMSTYLFGFFDDLLRQTRLSWIIALLLFVTPPFSAYGFLNFTELPTAFMLIVLIRRAARRVEFGMLDAALIGWLPWMHARNFAVAGVAALCFAAPFVRDRRRPTARSMASAAAAAALWLGLFAMNARLWGSVSPSAPWRLAGRTGLFAWRNFFTTLPSQFVDRGYGLLAFTPIYAFSAAGLVFLYRRRRPVALCAFAVGGTYLLTIASFSDWWAGWSPGPRYLVPVVPILALGVAMWASLASERPMGRRVLAAVLGLSFILAILFWCDPRLLWNHEDELNLFWIRWFGAGGLAGERLLPSYFDLWPRPQIVGGLWILALAALNAALAFGWRPAAAKTAAGAAVPER